MIKKDETPSADREFFGQFQHGWTPLANNRPAPGGDTIAPDSFTDSLGKKVPNAE